MRRSLLVSVLLVVLVVGCYSLATNGDSIMSRNLRSQMVPNDAISHRGKIISKAVSTTKEAEERGGAQMFMLNPAITGASTTSSNLNKLNKLKSELSQEGTKTKRWSALKTILVGLGAVVVPVGGGFALVYALAK
ncbi:Putative RxLR effector [Phytophthora palmivora]|uniref:RxLR effector n=1 Tax=Phytophthora palmivora TaxID=4796 RepID=A0A2P4XL58_9STRA|nr:Putative RxLR effector [Phytophthora palmivora]